MSDNSSPASLVPTDVAVRLTAAIYIGNDLNMLLMGVLIVQTYYYFLNFGHKDNVKIQLLALFTLLFELAQTLLVARDGYILFCSSWGVPSALLRSGLIWLYLPTMGSIMSFVAQLFWAWRLHLLTRVKWIPAIVILASTVQLVAGIATGIIGSPIKDVTRLSFAIRPASIYLAGTAIVDLIIVVFMLYFCSKSRTWTSFADTRALLSKVLFLTIETGMCCASVAIIDLAIFLSFRDQNWHVGVGVTLSKIYGNSLLLVLNSRDRTSREELEYRNTSQQQDMEIAFRRGGINISVTQGFVDDGRVHIPMVDIMKSSPVMEGVGKKNDESYSF
ncbi:hypothetical protein C8J56DRAFT_1169791 [Mycena floridula]|nr:hypothetical protein C8J56DRAFT_1169791 [Mycena floridula]